MSARSLTILSALLLCFSFGMNAQVNWFPKVEKPTDYDWKSARTEIYLGIGTANYLGELGGLDRERSPLIFDLEPTQFKYSFSGGFRYYLQYQHALTTTFSYARITGDDKLTNYPNRNGRNLHFRSPIVELSTRYEFHLLRPIVRHTMNINRTVSFNGRRFGIFGFVGVGAFYFNPKAEFGGAWIPLQPLGTEGQGLPGGPRPYSRIAIAYPIGFGFTYQFHRYLLGFEYGLRLTSTDYLDDASGTYYNNDVIRRERGEVAAYLANPSEGTENPQWYEEGSVRGNPKDNDAYMFVQITFSRSTAGVVHLKRPKLKRKKAKFAAKNPKDKRRTVRRKKKARKNNSAFR
ncbi:MAG: hypothetical protein ACFB10_13000 [Salibacteraceae bacterium]